MLNYPFARSRELLRVFAALLVVGIIVGVPYGWLRYREHLFRNFRVVREGVLYRSGQMSLAGLKRMIHNHGIKTVITLREAAAPGQPPPDADEEEYCKKQEVYHYRIPPRAWETPTGAAPAAAGVARFRDIMRDPKHHPVLLHCFAGIHRTGAYVAVYRMEFEGWPNDKALAEMRALGYVNLHKEHDVRGFLERYQPNMPAVRPVVFQPDPTPHDR